MNEIDVTISQMLLFEQKEEEIKDYVQTQLSLEKQQLDDSFKKALHHYLQTKSKANESLNNQLSLAKPPQHKFSNHFNSHPNDFQINSLHTQINADLNKEQENVTTKYKKVKKEFKALEPNFKLTVTLKAKLDILENTNFLHKHLKGLLAETLESSFKQFAQMHNSASCIILQNYYQN